jgi:hypothetical protein
MKRNVFGALIVAGGLALATSVASFASTPGGLTPDQAKAAVATCASEAVLTVPTTLQGEAATEAAELKAESALGIAEIVAEANSNIDEAAAEANEDGAKELAALPAELQSIVDESCKAIANVKKQFDAAMLELVAESTQPNVDKPEVETADVDKAEKTEKRDKPEVRSTTREGND